MGMARKPSLLREETEAERRDRFLLELIVIPQIHTVVGVLQNVRFNYVIFSCFHTL
jgi:hypothetical protein